MQLQEQSSCMGGADLNFAGKGWLVTALLCIACTLTVWDLMMCSICKATDRTPLSSHVQDIFAALPRMAGYSGLADQLQRIIIRGTMQQLKQEMSKPPGSIPHIMNWVYFGPEGTLFRAIESGHMTNQGMNSCIMAHRHWVHLAWDNRAIETLVHQRYPQLLSTFHRLRHSVMKEDMGRYLVLHQVGGIYLDTDTECYTAVDTMLDGADVVLQATTSGAINLAMASRPGQSFWETAWGLIEQRSRDASLVDNVLVLSGPDSLSDALKSYLNLGADYWQKRNGDNVVNGDTLRVWPAGSFMCPCFVNDDCYSNMTMLHAKYEVPEDVTGLHRWQGPDSWSQLSGTDMLLTLSEMHDT